MPLPSSKSGLLTAVGPAPESFESHGGFNLSIWGIFVGTVGLERSFDGSTWLPFTYVDGSQLAWSAPMSTTLEDPEVGVRWRVRAVSLTSGTINWRLSR
jgi:hypothetical protein